MLTVSLSSPPAPAPAHSVSSLSIYDNNINNKNFLSLQNIAHQSLFLVPRSSSSLKYNPFRVSIDQKGKIAMNKNRRGFGAVCYAAPLTAHNIQWISVICSAVLMFAKGTAVHKSFLVPLFALQAPAGIISWMKGEYGIWSAFLALLVRLFFSFPGELELPFLALLLVIVAPYQVMKFRGTQEGSIIALVIAGYLAFQHFSWAGSLRKAFDQGSIVPTLAIICITALSCLLLI